MIGEDYMHRIKLILIVLAIVVLSATSFECIAQAAQIPNINRHSAYVGTVLEISSSEATVEVDRKLAKRPGRRRPGARRSTGVVVVDENAGNNQEQDIIQEGERKQDQEREKEEERKKEQERKKDEERINKEDWFR